MNCAIPRYALGAALLTISSVASADDPTYTNPPPPPSSTTTTTDTTTQTSTTKLTAADVEPQQGRVTADMSEEVSPVNRPLLLTGGVILVGSYVPAMITAAASDRHEDNRLYIPVVGPWLDLANRDCVSLPCPNETMNTTLLIGGGILQGIGAVGVVTSLFIPEKRTRNWYLIGNDTMHVLPTSMGYGAAGITAGGKF
jgi:hypothetical protein